MQCSNWVSCEWFISNRNQTHQTAQQKPNFRSKCENHRIPPGMGFSFSFVYASPLFARTMIGMIVPCYLWLHNHGFSGYAHDCYNRIAAGPCGELPKAHAPSLTGVPLSMTTSAPISFTIRARVGNVTRTLTTIIIVRTSTEPLLCVITEISSAGNQFGTDEQWTRTCFVFELSGSSRNGYQDQHSRSAGKE